MANSQEYNIYSMYLQYSRPLIYHRLPNVWKVSYTISAPISLDVPYWPHYSMDKFISCVVTVPSQWFFHFGGEIVISSNSGESEDSWWYGTSSFSMTVQGVTPLLSRTSCAAGNGRIRNIHRTRPIWLHGINIISPKWKIHYEGPCTTQEMTLFLL